MQITDKIVSKLLGIIDKGLCHGSGFNSRTGDVCVQQAVNIAVSDKSFDQHLGRRPTDRPSCVHIYVRDFGVRLNDRFQGSAEERAKLLRKFAVAELGSSSVNMDRFRELLVTKWNKKYPNRYALTPEQIIEWSKKDAADTAVEVLTELKSPGTEYLYMCEPGAKLKPKHKKALQNEQEYEKELEKRLTQWKGFGKKNTQCKGYGTSSNG